MAVSQVIREGLAADDNRCPRGHQFVWGNQHDPSQPDPSPGELVVCAGGDDYMCGYNFVWRGGDKLLEVTRQIMLESQSENAR
jgi:hypothetical protein